MRLFIYKMGRQVDKIFDAAFDARYVGDFKAGDLVSWCNLGEKSSYGFIVQIYLEELSEGRKFIFAKVRKTDGTQENFMLSSLTKES